MMTNGKSKRPFSHCYDTPPWEIEPIAACIPYKKLHMYCTTSERKVGKTRIFTIHSNICVCAKNRIGLAQKILLEIKNMICRFLTCIWKILFRCSQKILICFHFILYVYIFHFEITGKSIHHNFPKICSQTSSILIKVKAF